MLRRFTLVAFILIEIDAYSLIEIKTNLLRRYRSNLDLESKIGNVPKDQYFTQKLCHFNPNITQTWQQRYWQNDQYVNDNEVQFLNIGGEGEENPGTITYEAFPLVTWAKKLAARLWNLEHRFYGKSRPMPDQSTKNLKYLNSNQALADLADFIKAKNKELNLKSPKWVVFGGSYPGTLALWFRQKYPELTVGAVGSSAPINLVTDFYDYLRVCEESYTSYSQKCANNIREGFQSLYNLLNSKSGRDQLDAAFNLQPPLAKQNLTYTHLQNVYYTIMVYVMVPVQFSRVNAGPFKNAASIPDVCDIMTTKALNPVVRLVKVVQYIGKCLGKDSSILFDDYESDVYHLANTSWASPEVAARSWRWQTCVNLGYLQSTDYDGIFGSSVPVDYLYNLCADVFGSEINVDYIQKRVYEFSNYYGRAKDYNATNVVLPNGSIDPWHALGAYTQNNPTMIPFLINGTAHCADMIRVVFSSNI